MSEYNLVATAQKIERSLGSSESFAQELKREYEKAVAVMNDFPIAKAANPEQAFDQGFELLLSIHKRPLEVLGGNPASFKTFTQDFREAWLEGSGINMPEIKQPIFEIMRGLNMWHEPHFKALLSLSILRSGASTELIEYSGGYFMRQMPEKDRPVLIYLADNAGEMEGKRTVDEFRERAMYGLQGIKKAEPKSLESFLNSSTGMLMKRFGVIEWFCEQKKNKPGKYADLFRPIFKKDLASEAYQQYLGGRIDYISRQLETFVRTDS